MRGWKSAGRQMKSARNTSNENCRAGAQPLAVQGDDETSLLQIAEDVSVDATLIVYHFRSKLEYLHAIIKRQSEELHAQLARSEGCAHFPNPVSVLRTAMESFVDFLVPRPVMPQFWSDYSAFRASFSAIRIDHLFCHG